MSKLVTWEPRWSGQIMGIRVGVSADGEAAIEADADEYETVFASLGSDADAAATRVLRVVDFAARVGGRGGKRPSDAELAHEWRQIVDAEPYGGKDRMGELLYVLAPKAHAPS